MVTFNLIEAHGHDYDYEKIREDYQNTNYSVEEIREKHNLSRGQWQGVIRRFKDDNITLRGNRIIQHNTANFYSYDKKRGKYRIQKTINGDYAFYGYFDTEKEAKAAVELLKENNWDKDVLKK